MNIVTPETIKVSKSNSSITNCFTLTTERIDFNNPRPLLQYKTLLARQILKK
ncbi:unnamed protein product [Paramecium pentaurelia]|uniref:Uncharacterized protein n=1 Tax=Paramecium pentaurelia TaxID=43138 RepID=A0A8S1RWD5_9CILI|nr:unnamed protein product [Paramecium pentaurelia]